MGLFLLGVWIVVLGAMIWFWENAFNLLERKGWHRNKYVRKVLDWAHIEVMELSEEEKKVVIGEIEDEVTKFIEGWTHSDGSVLAIPLVVLGLDEYEGLESVLDALYALIEDSRAGEYVVDIELEDESNLIIHLAASLLNDKANERDLEWKYQKLQEEQEYWASRGVI